jgi:hypothetical protein
MSTPTSRSLALAINAGANVVATAVVNIVNVTAVQKDRRHQREVLLAAALEQSRAWDLDSARRHEAFHAALQFAEALAKAGHIDQASQVVEQGAALVNHAGSPPEPLAALMNGEVL